MIYLKYVFNRIKSKIFKSILIIIFMVFSLTTSVLTMSVMDLTNTLSLAIKSGETYNADYYLQSESGYINIDLAKEKYLDAGYDVQIHGLIDMTGNLESNNKQISICGIDLEYIDNYNNYRILECQEYPDWYINDICYISKSFAKKNNIKLNDSVRFRIGKYEFDLDVKAIMDDSGLFFRNDIVCNKEEISSRILSLFDFAQKAIVLTDVEDSSIRDFTNTDSYLKNFTFEKGRYGSSDTSITRQRIILVVFISMNLIIYYYTLLLFIKLITKDRQKDLNIFRSLGARNYHINLVYILEFTLYLLIAYILAIISSIFIINIVRNYLGTSSISKSYPILELTLIVLLTFIITIATIIYFNFRNTKNKDNSKQLLIIGLVMAVILLPLLFIKNLYVDIISLILLVGVISVLLPFIFEFIFYLFGKSNNLFGAISKIFKRNINLKNFIRIFILSLSFGMCLIFVYNMFPQMLPYNNPFNNEVFIFRNNGEQIQDDMIDAIKDEYPDAKVMEIVIDSISTGHKLIITNDLDYIYDDIKDISLEPGQIILSRRIMDNEKLSIGDTILINSREYTIKDYFTSAKMEDFSFTLNDLDREPTVLFIDNVDQGEINDFLVSKYQFEYRILDYNDFFELTAKYNIEINIKLYTIIQYTVIAIFVIIFIASLISFDINSDDTVNYLAKMKKIGLSRKQIILYSIIFTTVIMVVGFVLYNFLGYLLTIKLFDLLSNASLYFFIRTTYINYIIQLIAFVCFELFLVINLSKKTISK